MTLAILDARDKEYVVVAAGADLTATYVQQAILAGQTAQEVLDAILAAGLSEGVFTSEAAGLSGTTDGQYFWVGSGGTVTLYLNDTGTGDEIAELATAASVTFTQSGPGSVSRPVNMKAREIVSFADKAALPDGSDATAGIDDALATARHVESGSGNYQAQGLTLTEAGQVLAARGNTNLMRNANGAILDTDAADITISGVSFYGESPTYSGDLLNFTGDRGKLLFAAARDTGSDDAVRITGSSWLMFGVNDVYDGNITFTTDGVGGVSQYHNVAYIRMNGDLSFIDTSIATVHGCLVFGDVVVDKGVETAGGHGSRFSSSRIVGNITITQSNTSIGSGMSVSGDMTIGDGTDNYDGITIDSSYVQASGFDFTILAGVKGSFDLTHIVTSGITPTIPASVRQGSAVRHGEIDYTPTISGGGGSFVLGNGSITAVYSQQGNIISGRVVLAIGSTTTLPTSGLFATLPVNAGGRPILCTIDIFEDGVGSYSAVGKGHSGGSLILGWRQAPSGIDDLFTASSPVALGTGDSVTWVFSYTLAGK